MKFEIGRGQRFAVIPYKYRLFLTAQKAPSSAKDIFYSLCQILNSDQADQFRDIPQTRLAVENGISVRQVERGVAWLKEHGLLKVKKRPGYPHLYFLTEPKELRGSDAEVMLRLKICPCDWSEYCPAHPSHLSVHLWK